MTLKKNQNVLKSKPLNAKINGCDATAETLCSFTSTTKQMRGSYGGRSI